MPSNTPILPPDDDDDITSPDDAIKQAFIDWHGKTARPWQVTACAELLRRHVEHPPDRMLRPLLLIRSTGGGKSAVRDITGILCGGIMLKIVPLLSLAADQTSKLLQLSIDQTLFHRFKVFNLDVIRSASLNNELRNHLEQLKSDADCKTIVSLFSSPQKITKDPHWQQTIASCCMNGTLRLLAVDECHLYAAHGMEFREEFGELRKFLFRWSKNEFNIPSQFFS